GAINNIGTTAVSDSTFTGNSARASGGAINNGAGRTLTVSDSTFTGNTATVHGGGIDNSGTAAVGGSTFTEKPAGSVNGAPNNGPGGLRPQFDTRSIDAQAPEFSP